jgi:hypothetical protein
MGALEWSASCSGEVGGREERPWREVICSVDGGGKNTPAEQTIEVIFSLMNISSSTGNSFA